MSSRTAGWLLVLGFCGSALAAPIAKLEAEIDSQTREDDELPPSSVLPYRTRFGGRRIPGSACGARVKDARVQALLDRAQALTDRKERAQVARAVPLLEEALRRDPRAGWGYLTLGSAYAKLGRNDEGTRAYETYLLSCRRAPNADRVQRILADYTLAKGGTP